MGMRVFCVFGWVVNGVVGSIQKQKRKRNAESFARKRTLNFHKLLQQFLTYA